MKKTIIIPVGKIMSVVAMGEGVCASALVDKALKVVPMNPVVKAIGRAAVSTAVALPFSASAAALWITDQFDIKIGGEKDSSGKRIENDDLEDLIENIDNHDEIYIGTFYKGEELLCIERINIAVKRGIINVDKGSELCAKIFKAIGATIDHEKMTDLVKNYTPSEIETVYNKFTDKKNNETFDNEEDEHDKEENNIHAIISEDISVDEH